MVPNSGYLRYIEGSKWVWVEGIILGLPFWCSRGSGGENTGRLIRYPLPSKHQQGRPVKVMETTIVYWDYIGIMKKNMETTIAYYRSCVLNCRSLGPRFLKVCVGKGYLGHRRIASLCPDIWGTSFSRNRLAMPCVRRGWQNLSFIFRTALGQKQAGCQHARAMNRPNRISRDHWKAR